MTTLEKLMFLRSVELFRSFTVEDLGLLATISSLVRLDPGQKLYQEGEAPDRLYVLVEGNVSLVAEKDGHYHLLMMLAEGDCFGEVAVFDGGSHLTSAQVEMEGRALALDREDILNLIREYPSLAISFLGQLARLVRELNQRVRLLEGEMERR